MQNILLKGEVIFATVVIAFAGLLIFEAGSIPSSFSSARVGPAIFPYMVSIALCLLGILLLIAALKGGWQEQAEKEIVIDYQAILYLLLGLTLNVALITKGGFTLASVVMFVLIARAFGSKDYLRNAGIALIFALIAYFGFVKLLKINIGSGIIENFIEGIIK